MSWSQLWSLDTLTAVITIVAMQLVARKRWEGWLVGLCNQVLWAVISIQKQMPGMLILVAAMTWTYASALRRWKTDDR